MPVHDTVCSGSNVAVSLEAQLALVRCPAGISLGFCFQQKIIVPFQTSSHVSAEGDFCSGQLILTGVIDIGSGDGEALGSVQMIHVRLYAEGISSPFKVQIVGDKLIFPPVFVDNRRLPA